MENFLLMAKIQVVLFLYLLVGFYANKRKIVPAEARQYFVDFILKISLPCMVFDSFNQTLGKDELVAATWVMVGSLGVCAFSWLIGKVIYRRVPIEQRTIMQYGTLISNSAFAGLPMVQNAYGPLGLFYGSFFLIPFRIFMWSAGISMFMQTDLKAKVKSVLLNPGVIAVELGLLRMLLRIPLPEVVNTAVKSIGGVTTSLSMICVGMIMADTPIRTVINRNVLYLSFVRLLALPLLTMAVMHLFGIDPLVIGVVVTLTAMPVGTTAALLAQKYGADYIFGSKCIFVTTALSLVTVPLMSYLMGIWL